MRDVEVTGPVLMHGVGIVRDGVHSVPDATAEHWIRSGVARDAVASAVVVPPVPELVPEPELAIPPEPKFTPMVEKTPAPNHRKGARR